MILALTKSGKLTTVRAVQRPERGGMNKTEKQYAQRLELLKRVGEVQWWAFERITFKLASDLRFTPDFVVLTREGELECHEVKGGKRNGRGEWIAYIKDDARKSLVMAAEQFQWARFVLMWPEGECWHRKEIWPA